MYLSIASRYFTQQTWCQKNQRLSYTIVEGFFWMLCSRQTHLLALLHHLRLSGSFVHCKYLNMKIRVTNSIAENSYWWELIHVINKKIGALGYTRGSRLYVACSSVCDHDQNVCLAKSMLDQSLLRLLMAWFSSVKGQIAAAHSWSIDFSSSDATLIRWSGPKNGFDRRIQFDPGRKHFHTGQINDYTTLKIGRSHLAPWGSRG